MITNEEILINNHLEEEEKIAELYESEIAIDIPFFHDYDEYLEYKTKEEGNE